MDWNLYSNQNPVEITAVLIGCSPRYTDFSQFNDDVNQLYPLFLRLSKTSSIRIFCIDPALVTGDKPAFIDEYFNRLGFSKNKNIYNNSNVEIIILGEEFIHEYENDRDFLYKLMETTLIFNSKLIVQEFTGRSLDTLFKSLLYSFQIPQQSELVKNVLFDITYQLDCHCSTPMTKYRPIFLKNGDFFNPTVYSDSEIVDVIGLSPETDNFIKIIKLKEYIGFIDIHHINYRRRYLEKPLGNFNSIEEYDDSASGDYIMHVLYSLIRPRIRILNLITNPSVETRARQTDLLDNYKTKDKYQWYTEMKSFYTTTSTLPPSSNI
jgi:hypothetical protein